MQVRPNTLWTVLSLIGLFFSINAFSEEKKETALEAIAENVTSTHKLTNMDGTAFNPDDLKLLLKEIKH